MKRYLLFGMAALAFGGIFTSCSHDVDFGGSVNQSVQQTYEEAFKTRFGEPAPTQTWGFGDPVATTRGLTRTIQPSHDFSADIPSAPTSTGMNSSNFLSEVPAGVLSFPKKCEERMTNEGLNWLPDELVTGDCYIDETFTGKTKIYGGNSTIYVKGSHDFTNGREWTMGDNMTIYLLEGATLKLKSGLQSGSIIYIANGASLIVEDGITTGTVSYYCNGGTIEAQSTLVINSGHELFCEGGTLKVGGKLQLQRATAYLHNTTVEVSGDIDVNQQWVNNANVGGLYYQDGGSFEPTNDKLVCNGGTFYTNVDTEFTYIEANGIGIIYNGANSTMTSTGEIKLTNGTSVMINDGDLVGTYLGTEGSALFQNNGNTTISGDTRVDSNQNTWVNNGQYRTNNFIYRALSDNVINNCRLTVDNLFSIKLGSTWPLDYDNIKTKGFRMESGSGVVTKDFEFMGPGFIHMGSNSVFKVTNTAYMAITNDIYGIYGPVSGDYAVFQAGSIVRGKDDNGGQISDNQGFVANYYKHLYVVADSHFDFGWSNVDKSQWEGHVEAANDQPYYRLADGAVLYAGGEKPNITISSSNCNPGFSPSSSTQPKVTTDTKSMRVIAEDLTVDQNTDFDFNDVVFDVIWTRTLTDGEVTSQEVKVILQAAGGTLPLYVAGHEVHEEFGEDQNVMINTSAAAQGLRGNDNAGTREITLTDDQWSGSTIGEIAKSIEVKVIKGGQPYILEAPEGGIASKIGVDIEYEWCIEREDIDHKYSLSDGTPLFSEWVKGLYPANDWYTYAKDEIVKYKAAKAALNGEGE